MKVPKSLAIVCFSLPWVAAAIFFGWILVQRLPPSGIFETTTTFEKASPFINPFLPSERVSIPGGQPDGWVGQRIMGDPTYATARVPGPYVTADVVIEFRAIHQPLVEFGVARGDAGNDLQLVPMYSSELSSDSWQAVSGGYVRSGLSATRLSVNDPADLAIWDASAAMSLKTDPVSAPQKTAVSLRGSHDFYLLPSGTDVDVTFGLQDVNRAKGHSTVSIRVFRGDEEVRRETFETGASRDIGMGRVFEHRIRVANVSPGVYRIALQMSDDVFIRGITTPSRHWVVGPRLVFGDVVGYAATTTSSVAWTTSRHLVAETFHAEGLQKIVLGHDSVTLRRTHESVPLDRTDSDTGLVQLEAPKGDVRFVGDGFFAFRPDAFFEPKPKRMTDATHLIQEHITGVLTPYQRPKDLGDGWSQAHFRFDLASSQDVLRFVLSAPGVASRAGAVDIRRITVSYQRPSFSLHQWIQLLVLELKNARHRL